MQNVQMVQLLICSTEYSTVIDILLSYCCSMPTNSGLVQTPLPILPKLFQGQISKFISKLLDEHSEHGTAMKIVKKCQGVRNFE